MSQQTADELLPLILPVARAYEQEIARLWRLYEVAPRLVDPWPEEPGRYAAWLLVQETEARTQTAPEASDAPAGCAF